MRQKNNYTIMQVVFSTAIAIFVIFAAVKAGSLTPGASPAATNYTFQDIYNRIVSGTTSVEANHLFAPSGSPAGSFYTLKQIYEAIPAIDATKLFSGVSYLGETGTLVLACATSSFDGMDNLITDALDGDGNGTNRWCITDTGDAVAGDVLSGKKIWIDGVEIIGTMPTQTLSAASETLNAGYYSATTLSAIDSDLTANKIMADTNIFGITGTLLKNLYNGNANSTVQDYAFYTQAKGGVDDYNKDSTAANGTYVGTWTTCSAADYCGTSDSNANKKDNSTGLVWSTWLDSGTTHTWFWANNCYEPETEQNPGTCVNNGDDACQCVKKTSAKTGCEALGDGNWRLPYQKELMQAYIDGSWYNLSAAGYNYWSATTRSNLTQFAWVVYLNSGDTNIGAKTNSASYRVRCVR
ncbi:MAG TPA: DUF1566 domain-containing protein [Candidatus Portnoybacteria bacterium]|mgnify:FL=1|nr:DUF1566 domain-containing protein [Candidatus Portnoybacteria bacterium]